MCCCTEEFKRDPYANICEDDVHPDLCAQRLHEGKHGELLFVGLLDHDADASCHEWLTEVDYALACLTDCQRCNCHVGFLTKSMLLQLLTMLVTPLSSSPIIPFHVPSPTGAPYLRSCTMCHLQCFSAEILFSSTLLRRTHSANRTASV